MLIEEVQHYSNLELLARKAKEGFITGIHSSPFHGFSVEFAEHRPYNAGESIRYLDWKLLARTDKKYIKQFNEETNLRANLWVDISGSMKYPAENPLKIKFSCLTAATLSFLFQQQKDSFSISLFNEQGFIHKQPVKSTFSHWQQGVGILQSQWDNSAAGNPYPFENNPISIDELSMQVHRRSLVLLFSDLLFGNENTKESDTFWKSIAFLKFLKCEIVIFHVFHQPTEIDLSVENRPTRFVDLETGTSIKLQPEEIQSAYSTEQRTWLKGIKDKLTEQDVEYIECDISQPVEHVLKSFFTRRRKK